MAEEQGKPDTKVLKGSLLLKILLLLGAILVFTGLIAIFIFKIDIGNIFWRIVQIIIGLIWIFLLLKAISSMLKPPPYSPTQNFRKKLITVAKANKPFNVRNLFIRGEDMRVYSKWGKILGLLFIHNLASIPETKKNKQGEEETVTIDRIDKETGKIIRDPISNYNLKIPKYKKMNEKDGDWLFVTKRGWWIFGTEEIVRADFKLCSPVGESCWIKTPNLVPIGDYLYPVQQWSEDIQRILRQHQSEVILETHEHFLDIVAHVTQMSLGADPTFQKIMQAQTENISNRSAGVLVRE